MSDDAGRELAKIQKWNLVVLALAIGWAALTHGSPMVIGVALGGVLGAANFWLTSQVVRRSVHPGAASSGFMGLKFVVLFGGVGWVLFVFHPDGAGFALGFCTMLIVIVMKALVEAVKQRKNEEIDSQPPKGPKEE